MEADRSTDGAPAAREMGGAGRRHRHRDRPATAPTARDLTSRAVRRRRRRHRSRQTATVGADRDTVGHLVDAWVASRVDVSPKTRLAVRVGGVAHPGGPRRDPGRSARARGRGPLARRARGRRAAGAPQHPDLPDGAASGPGRRRRGRGPASQPSCSCRRCRVRWPSPTASARWTLGPRSSSAASLRRSAGTAGRHPCGSRRCTGCGAASCSACAGRPST